MSATTGFLPPGFLPGKLRWNVVSACDRLRRMYKRLLIFGTTGLFFLLGLNYLVIYPLQQSVTRELERQDKIYWSAFNAIEHFGEQPNSESQLKAKAALDDARAKHLSKTRQVILQNYFQDLEHCYQGDRDACKKANTDMNHAIRAPR
jgi:hypothetical protein